MPTVAVIWVTSSREKVSLTRSTNDTVSTEFPSISRMNRFKRIVLGDISRVILKQNFVSTAYVIDLKVWASPLEVGGGNDK